jgi:hypothetical protein
MAWHFKVVQIDPLKGPSDEVTLPAGWEPFQIDRGGAAGWIICLRMEDGLPIDKPAGV